MRDNELDELAEPLWRVTPRDEDRLVRIYEPLVIRLAFKRAGKCPQVPHDEFIQSGRIALLDCIRRFDPDNERGASFATFATWRVGFALKDSQRENDWVQNKVRAREKAGAIELPDMVPLNDTMDVAVDYTPQSDRLGDLLDYAEPIVRGVARLAIDCELDGAEIGKRLGVSEYLGGHLTRWVVAQLQATPCMMH